MVQRVLQIRNEEVNEQIRLELLNVGRDFNAMYGFFSKAVLAMLAFFTNNPTALMSAFSKGGARRTLINSSTVEGEHNGGQLEVYRADQQRRGSHMPPLALPPSETGKYQSHFNSKNIEELEKLHKRNLDIQD